MELALKGYVFLFLHLFLLLCTHQLKVLKKLGEEVRLTANFDHCKTNLIPNMGTLQEGIWLGLMVLEDVINKIAVIGTGVIGSGWIVRFLAHNKKVIAYDKDIRLKKKIIKKIKQKINK